MEIRWAGTVLTGVGPIDAALSSVLDSSAQVQVEPLVAHLCKSSPLFGAVFVVAVGALASPRRERDRR